MNNWPLLIVAILTFNLRSGRATWWPTSPGPQSQRGALVADECWCVDKIGKEMMETNGWEWLIMVIDKIGQKKVLNING